MSHQHPAGTAVPGALGETGPLRHLRWPALLVCSTVAYYLLMRVGELLIPPEGPSAMWPAAGLSAVLLLWAGSWSRRLIVLLSVVLASGIAVAVRGSLLPNDLGYLLGNLLEPLLMLPFLLRAVAGDRRLHRLTSVAWLAAGGVVAAGTAGLLVAVLSVWSFDGSGDPSTLAPIWLAFTTGDLLGLLIVAPLLLQAQPLNRLWSRGSAAEQVVLWALLALALSTSVIAGPWLAVGLVVLVLLALRLDSSAASLAVALVSLALINDWLIGLWPDGVDVRLVLPVLAILIQLIALGSAEREEALSRRQEALAESEHTRNILQAVMDSARSGVAMYRVHPSLDGQRPRFQLMFMNRFGLTESGLDPDLLAGQELSEFYPDLVSTGLYDHFVQAWAQQQTLEFVVDSSDSITNWQGVYQNRVVPVGPDHLVATGADVTEVARAQRDAEADRITLRRALDSGLDAFAIYERNELSDWSLVFVNSAGASRSGAPADELIGAPPDLVIPVEALDQVRPLMEVAYETGEAQQTLADLTGSKSGWRGDFDIMVTPTPDDRIVVTWRDVSEMQSAHRSLRSAHAAAMHASTHDPLTNLPNRLLLRDRLINALAIASRSDDQVAVVFLDLDGFKTINDRHGHHLGDAVLSEVARRLVSMTRDGDTAARLSGDEFVLLLTGVDPDWDAQGFHRRLTEVLHRPFEGEVRLQISASAGVALSGGAQVDADDLLRDADLAMYRSKSAGPGLLTVFAESLRAEPDAHRPTAVQLASAVERDELVVMYQPIVEVSSGTVVGHEALVRWQHPQLGLLPPGQFLDLAESTGLITELGQYVLRRAIDDGARGAVRGWISVNVALTQLLRADVADAVRVWCAEVDLAPSAIVVELTEGQLLEANPAVVRQLAQLRQLGCRIALDDFGAGYSSFAYLEEFPVDVIKIDQAMIANRNPSGERCATMLRWLAALGHTLDCEMVAEGIEEPEQLALVRDAGIRLAQGYLLGRPAPVTANLTLPGQV